MKNKTLAQELWTLSYPTMIAFLLQSVYDMVDMVWVGRISSDAVAGVTIFTLIYWLFNVLNEVIGSGSISMLSQSFGRKEGERTANIAEQTITFKFLMGLVTAAALFFLLKPLALLYTKDREVLVAVTDYGWIRVAALPLMFVSFSVNNIFRCTGDPKTPMKIMLAATLLNLVLDPLLIFSEIPGLPFPGAGLGVFGAGLATVIATGLSLLLGFYFLYRRKDGPTISFSGLFTLRWSMDKTMIRTGLPNGIQMFLQLLFQAVLSLFIAGYGVEAIAATGIGNKIYNFAFLPLEGFMMGGSVLVGRLLGENQEKSALSASRTAAVFNFMIMTAFTVIALWIPELLVKIFIRDPVVVSMGVDYLRYAMLGLPFLGIGFGLSVAFIGSGYNRPLLIGGLISRWIVQLPLLYLVKYLELPLSILFATYMIADVIEFLVFFLFYRQMRWISHRV